MTREAADGHLLDRPDDELGAGVGLAHGVGARLSPGRDHAGAAEPRVGLHGERDELVGEDAAAEDPVVVVAEVGGRDRRPGPDAILHGLVEDADGAGVDVTLEIAADLVVRGSDLAGQQQPGGLDRARGDDDVARAHRELPARPRELRADDAGPPRDESRGGGAGEEVAAAGGERARDGRVVAAVLGAGVAGEAGAGAAPDARRAPAVGHRVDEQRHRAGGQPDAPRRRVRARAPRRSARTAASGSRGSARRRTGAVRPRRTRPSPTRPGRRRARRPRSRSASPRTARRRPIPSGSPRGRTAMPSRRTRASRRRRSSRCCSRPARWAGRARRRRTSGCRSPADRPAARAP